LVRMVQKEPTGINLFDGLSIKGTKRWKQSPPEKCPYCCTGGSVQGIEILAAYDGPLFWECSHCGERMLRFTKNTTVKHLDKTVDLFVDLEGLDRIWEQVPN